MIAESGQFFLALAFVAASAQMMFALFAGLRAPFQPPYAAAARQAAYAHGFLLLCAFLALVILFLRSDFSVALVAHHSHSTKPLLYKISASWGNHEGSLLLWSLFLGICSAALAFFARAADTSYGSKLKLSALSCQGAISILFLAFLIFASNPFARLVPIPFQGAGLNPILQDPALAIHPPILYVGYVGFSLAFSFAIAALCLARRTEDARAWANITRWPIQISWVALTGGVALGSWWAYRELGWGGFWFWDPVENAALMPWLAGTALLHAVIITQKRGSALSWAVLLSILTFSLSMLGTFLTRSGIIVSVHSFASDPTRGIFILLILTLLCGGGFALFAARAHLLARAGLPTSLNSREAAIMANSLFLIAALSAVLTGTLYPIIFEALTGETIAVGAPYFNATFIPIMLPLLLLMPLAPFFAWAGQRAGAVIRPLVPAALAALLGGLLVAFAFEPRGMALALASALSVWVVAGALTRLWVMRRNLAAEAAMICAHIGVGLLLAGVIGAGAGQIEHTKAFAKGEAIMFAGYKISFEGVAPHFGADYRAERAKVLIRNVQGDALLAELTPEVRHYIARATPTREAAIKTFLFPPADLHAILGDRLDSNKRTMKFYYNPLAPLLWLGAFMMALGGVLSLIRRVRRT